MIAIKDNNILLGRVYAKTGGLSTEKTGKFCESCGRRRRLIGTGDQAGFFLCIHCENAADGVYYLNYEMISGRTYP